MTYSSQYQMPGAYFDSQSNGIHPSVFRPPISPSTASVQLSRSTNGLSPEDNTSPGALYKRKRARNDPSREQTPLQEWSEADLDMEGSTTSTMAAHLQTQTPGQTTQRDGSSLYTLGGQLETPGGFGPQIGGNGQLEESLYSDSDYRRALGSKRPLPGTEESPGNNGQPTLLVHPSQLQQQAGGDGWSKFAFNTIGGVVGKVWQFCKAGAFKGFYAGGGQGYSINGQTAAAAPRMGHPLESPENHDASHAFEAQFPTLDASTTDSFIPGVPGGFPQSEYIPYNSHILETAATPDSTPSRPAAKRRQIGETDELRRNWVMVDESAPAASPGSVSRSASRQSARPPISRNSRPSLTTGRRISVPVSRLNSTPVQHRRSSNRISHAGSPALSAREPASFAGARLSRPASPAPPSPSRIPIPSYSNLNGGAAGTNQYARPASASGHYRAGSGASPINPSFSHRRTHSGASAAAAASPRGPKPQEVEDEISASPRLDAEAKKLAAKRRREEHDADARINDFNARLKAMIRQGKEALGTTIEVEEDVGGGWESDE